MSHVAFDLPEQLSERERQDLEHLLPGLATSLLRARRAKINEDYNRLVDLFLGGTQPRPLDVRKAELEARARRWVFENAEWLTAADIAVRANLGQANPAATIGRWKQSRRIFAIRRDDRDYFPRYGLGDDFRPLPRLADVLQVLAGYSGERLATWFESTSKFLGGGRPRELLATQPDRVLAAARNALEAEEFLG